MDDTGSFPLIASLSKLSDRGSGGRQFCRAAGSDWPHVQGEETETPEGTRGVRETSSPLIPGKRNWKGRGLDGSRTEADHHPGQDWMKREGTGIRWIEVEVCSTPLSLPSKARIPVSPAQLGFPGSIPACLASWTSRKT